ncbi:FimV/HubP family polar landmark protein [Hydrocarboniphaga sp.]|uniref:FimV/HubP family polar landmark protein n=1 Tax=Hydrocarboniphaga sp. TaxID=2033016 RepID=UPI002ABAF639|nr:FimV/HubP family polar landmark protein [Hydrocarboniphaga sp.]MDZ4080191.1 FimV/HubP family polar landmark protein [Hydrocarboniphaga sp.]
MLLRMAKFLVQVVMLFTAILSAGLPAAQAAEALYGPVRPGESFWIIADTLREKPRVSQEQEMLALYLYNTESFTGGLDGLQKGATLRVPTAEQALEISQEDAARYIANLHRYKGVPPSMRHLVRKAGAAAPTPVTGAEDKTAVPQPEPPAASLPASPSPSVAAAAETPSAPAATATPDAQNPAALAEAAPAAEEASAVEVLAVDQASASPADAGPEPVSGNSAQTEPAAVPPDEAQGTDILGVRIPLPTDWLILIGLGLVFLLLILAQAARVRRSLGEKVERVPPAPPRAPVAPVLAPVVAKPEPVEPVPEPSPEPVFAAAEAAPVVPMRAVEAPEPLPEEPPALNDPIADADFQLGYGHWEEAITGLEEALLIAPMSRDVIMKLAETYAEAGRAAEFEQLVARYNGTFGDSDWMRVQSLGRQLRPESQLFGGWVPVPPAPAGWLQPVPDDALDLSTPAALEGQAIPADQLPPEFGEFDLDSLETEDGPFTTDDVGTKLDLARAYLDMDDQEMARSLLDEVIEQGNDAQKQEAQELRDQLPPSSPSSPAQNSLRDA